MENNNNKVENFFIKLGKGIKKGFFGLINWVKNTAWIQPLLIVGVIFGVILCIKPVTNWIGGLFNPDESFVFYKEHKTAMKTAKENAEKATGTVILFFYSDSSSTCKSVEKTIKNFQSANTSIVWYTIDCDGDTTTNIDDIPNNTEQDQIIDSFTDLFLTEYAPVYENGYECLKSSSHSELEIESGIPTPMLARYDNGVLQGVKIDLSTSKTADDLENFAKGDVEEDWKNFEL